MFVRGLPPDVERVDRADGGRGRDCNRDGVDAEADIGGGRYACGECGGGS